MGEDVGADGVAQGVDGRLAVEVMGAVRRGRSSAATEARTLEWVKVLVPRTPRAVVRAGRGAFQMVHQRDLHVQASWAPTPASLARARPSRISPHTSTELAVGRVTRFARVWK